jgi:hypothetical protein
MDPFTTQPEDEDPDGYAKWANCNDTVLAATAHPAA